jgi:hypothetical protein
MCDSKPSSVAWKATATDPSKSTHFPKFGSIWTRARQTTYIDAQNLIEVQSVALHLTE